MLTLDKLISLSIETSTPQRGWVDEPGFEALYVRVTSRYLGEQWRSTFDISNVTSSKPGSGTLTRLLQRLKREYPDLTIFVESVAEQRFRDKLRRMGFVGKEMDGEPFNFYLLPDKDLIV